MTRNALILALAPLAFASAVAAQTALPEVPDTDGNGSWSLEELQAVWTDLTEDTFNQIDTDADAAVTTAELQAAVDGGVIAVPAN